jgi:hypothetical protein
MNERGKVMAGRTKEKQARYVAARGGFHAIVLLVMATAPSLALSLLLLYNNA